MLVGWQLMSSLSRLGRKGLLPLAMSSYSTGQKKVLFKRITNEQIQKPAEDKPFGQTEEPEPVQSITRLKPFTNIVKRTPPTPEQTEQVRQEVMKPRNQFNRAPRQHQRQESRQAQPIGEPKKTTRRRNEFLEERQITTYKYEERQANITDELNKLKYTKLSNTFKDYPLYQRLVASQLKPQERSLDGMYIKKKNVEHFKKEFIQLFTTVTNSLLRNTPDKPLSKHIEPTFELESRKRIQAFSLGGFTVKSYLLQTTKNAIDAQPQCQILEVLHIKGLDLIRNHNFTSEEYVVEKEYLKDGFLEYLPHLEQDGRYLEIAYRNLHKMILQVKCLIDLPYSLTLKSSTGQTHTISGQHYVQFESQLREPPMFAQMKLEKNEYVASYRLLKNSWVITDIDGSNSYAGFDYSLSEKTQLYSRLV